MTWNRNDLRPMCRRIPPSLAVWTIGTILNLDEICREENHILTGENPCNQVADALELKCLNFRGLDLRLKPTELDVSQQAP